MMSVLNFLTNWKILKNTRVTNMPLEVSLEVTNVCNFKCEFCPQSKESHFEGIGKNYLDTNSAEYALKSIRDFGYKRDFMHWTLDGDPFMNKSFSSLCEIGSKFGFKNQYLATNAALLTRKRVEELPKEVKFTFTVDFCADKDFFENVRGTPGSWQKVLNNINNVLSSSDLDHINFVVKDISSYKISDSQILKDNYQNLRTLFVPSKKLKVQTKTFHNATGLVSKIANRRNGNSYFLCPYPWSSLMISANGDVVVCCRDLEHKTVMGNIYKNSLAEIWNGEVYQSVRRKLIDQKPCEIEACRNCDLPYDSTKFSAKNFARVVANRLQLFN